MSFVSDVPVRFFAAEAAGAEPENSETYVVDPVRQTDRNDMLLQPADFGGIQAVATVAPGTSLDGVVPLQVWARGACPLCILQIVYGLDGTPLGCLVDGEPHPWPGVGLDGAMSLTAPGTPGTYFVEAELEAQYNCADAMLLFDGFERRRIGVVIVR